MNKLSVVDIYCRTATNDQDSRAKLEQQQAACRAFCEEYGLFIGKVHYEIASGNTYRDRERLDMLRIRYRSRRIRGIVVTDLNRLSRSLVHILVLLEEMERYGVLVYCLTSTVGHTFVGKSQQEIADLFAEVEREKAQDTLAADFEH